MTNWYDTSTCTLIARKAMEEATTSIEPNAQLSGCATGVVCRNDC